MHLQLLIGRFFYTDGVDTTWTRPSSMAEPAADVVRSFEQYAAQTVRAIQHVVSEFPGLSLHDRLAIIVPNRDFRGQLAPPLQRQLASAFPERELVLVDAARASASCVIGGSEVAKAEWLVFDDMEQMDGLERLIVVCVGLDAAKSADESTLERRSMLYRAITRAHMMVLAVNEYLPDGWFAFLAGVRLGENKKFDEKKTMAAATVDVEATEQVVAAAALQRQQCEEQADGILDQRARDTAGLIGHQRAFLKGLLVAALTRGSSAAEAMEDALTSWERDQLLQQIPAAVAEAAGIAGIANVASTKALESLAAAKLQRGGTLEACVQATVETWQQATGELDLMVEDQRLRISDAVAVQLVAAATRAAPSATAVRDVVAGHVLSEMAKERRLSLSFAAMQLMERTVQASLGGGGPVQTAVQEALAEWLRIDAAVSAETRQRQIDRLDSAHQDLVADLVVACRDLQPGQTVEQAVSAAVDEWLARAEATEAERRKDEVVQSIWDASTNATAKKEPEPQPPVRGHSQRSCSTGGV